ncbi:hypothetical protein BH23CHL5_BH23CHL5_04750 [soil metagenome]
MIPVPVAEIMFKEFYGAEESQKQLGEHDGFAFSNQSLNSYDGDALPLIKRAMIAGLHAGKRIMSAVMSY